MAANHYCDSEVLEEWWAGWLATSTYEIEEYFDEKKQEDRERLTIIDMGDNRNWQEMSEMLYTICLGITKKFKPRDDDEYYELANEAMSKLMIKIEAGKLHYKPRVNGGSPVFNLITTTVQRILYSYKNQIKQRRIRHSKYVRKIVQEQAPELMSSIKDLYD